MLAQYTDSLAGQLDRFSTTLRDREIGSLLEDAKQLAHRQPEMFVAGALAAGFVLGRFFKSSRQSRSYQDAYSEYDPRDPSRIYGEQYGQGYGEQFSRSRGPEYSRDYDAGYRSGYQPEYGQVGQGSQRQYGQSTQYDPGANDPWVRNSNDQWSQGSNQPSSQGSSQSYGQASGQQSGQASGQSTARVTTHGVGTGQSIDREADLRKGQEFGQGEEQVSNYKGNDTKKASESAQNPNKREDGELR
jgi:hypothetical protein